MRRPWMLLALERAALVGACVGAYDTSAAAAPAFGSACMNVRQSEHNSICIRGCHAHSAQPSGSEELTVGCGSTRSKTTKSSQCGV
mmetsp:Transcript_8462/g.14788  ORF Transcript_8462/g.14788 Transcript_8462/m.14788 type:complete len:86 (-) Transcript_8462:121-378(-)